MKTTMERPPALPGIRPHLTHLSGMEPGYQAYWALYAGYAAVPVIAGLDKFGHYLVDWNKYLSPFAARLVGGQVDDFMRLVGVIEVAAGILVAVRPRWGALVVSLWLLGIAANLLLIPGYFDIALRDFGLAVGAFALWRLSGQYGPR